MSIRRLSRRAPIVGVSNDCIWINSSFTIPPVPGLAIRFTVTRVASPGPEKASTSPRVCPIASISSMNPIAPPSLRAAFFSALKKALIFQAVIPNHIDWKAGALTKKNGTPASAAIALARCVLPVPGLPSNSTPRRGLPPSSSRKVL